jgi:hypothetical protein
MTTTYPLTIDSFDPHVDNVDDVMAADVVNLGDAVVALQTAHRDYALMRVKNTSGSTVAGNDVGYIDSAGEFKLTTTAYLNAAWAVVIEGAANNSDIIVARRGLVTVVLNANCSIGDFLYTSTTSKQAGVLAYCRPEILGVAKTANAGGAGGTCVALLLTERKFYSSEYTADVQRVNTCSDTNFTATINGAPVGAAVVYTVVSGDELSITPVSAAHLGKFVLFNTTRSDYALIESVNTGTNTITLTDTHPATWQDTDAITTESPTIGATGASFEFYEIEIATAPNLATEIHLQMSITDTSVTTGVAYVHPIQTYDGYANQSCQVQVASKLMRGRIVVKLVNKRAGWGLDASGAGTHTCIWRMYGWTVAEP